MSKDVITGPGEYRMRDWPRPVAIVLAIVGEYAVGYRIDDDGTPAAMEWSLDGCFARGKFKHRFDILPPARLIDGPGPYECRGGDDFHCAVVDAGGTAFGYINGTPCQRFADTGKQVRDEVPRPYDVIRKRVTP